MDSGSVGHTGFDLRHLRHEFGIRGRGKQRRRRCRSARDWWPSNSLAAYQLIGVQRDKRPTTGNFTARIGTARLAVAFTTEATRIDLNAASKELLTGLFVGLGAMPFDASGYADRIIAWRTKAPAQSVVDTDPENSLYRSVGLSYPPRHAPFVHTSELWLVYSIPQALIARALPFVTVFSGQSQIDVLDAAPQVIAALPNMTPQTLQEESWPPADARRAR